MNTLGLELSTPGAQGSRYCQRGPVGIESQADHDSGGGTWCVEAPTHTYTTPTCSPACPLKGWLSSKVLPSPGKPHHSQESRLAPERSRMPTQAAGHSQEQAVTVDVMRAFAKGTCHVHRHAPCEAPRIWTTARAMSAHFPRSPAGAHVLGAGEGAGGGPSPQACIPAQHVWGSAVCPGAARSASLSHSTQRSAHLPYGPVWTRAE